MALKRRDLFNAKATYEERDVLVCIFQRGAADGLNSIVPWGDAEYALRRPRIAVPPPGEPGGALDIDGFFGLHPALAPVWDLFAAGDLAVVHACGVPHGSRSHFDAQSLVEGGVLSKTSLVNGWLGRHLATSTALSDSAFRAVAIAGNVPLALTGAEEPVALSGIGEFGLGELTGSSYQDLLGDLYSTDVPFNVQASAAIRAMDELQRANPAQFQPENGAQYPDGEFGNAMRQAAQLIKSSLGTEIVFIDVGDWDHHENLPNFLPNSLDRLARGLRAFYQDMGAKMASITVLVHTEFGRRVADNAASGTDHGTAGVAYLLGGGVNGGQVAGSWPGLAEQDLQDGEDLQITTDLRTVMSELLLRRLGRSHVADVFPGFTGPVSAGLFL